MACHPVQPADELRIREIQMFGNAQGMQIGSLVEDGRPPPLHAPVDRIASAATGSALMRTAQAHLGYVVVKFCMSRMTREDICVSRDGYS
jgi:hypothetical protein